MERAVAVFLEAVVCIALGVCKYGHEPSELKVKDEIVEVPRLLDERILDENVVVRKEHQFVVLQSLMEKLVDAILCRMQDFDIVAASVEFGVEHCQSRLDSRIIVLERHLCHMR